MKKISIALLFSLCMFIPFIASASLDTNLYYGLQQNSDVKQLQQFLIDRGFLTGDATGNFFSSTLKAVKDYQTSVSISSTGYVGALTRTKINNDIVASLSTSNQESTNTSTKPTTTINTVKNQINNLEQQIINIKQQYYADSEKIQNSQTAWQQQANAQLKIDQDTWNQLVSQNPNHLEFQQGQKRIQQEEIASQMEILQETISVDVQQVGAANQAKQAILQILLNIANQKIAQLNLQIQQLQIQQ